MALARCSASLLPTLGVRSTPLHTLCVQPPTPSQARRHSLAAAPVAARAACNAASSSPASPRTAARQQRICKDAIEVRRFAQRGVGERPRDPTEQPLNEQRLGSEQIEAVAAVFLQVGMDRGAVLNLLTRHPAVASLEPQALEPKLASVCVFLQGVKYNRASGRNKLCYAAAQAVILQCSDTAFEASCGMLAELCSAASPGTAVAAGKEAVLALLRQETLDELLLQQDSKRILAVFHALHERLGWSQQNAAAALLGLGVQHDPTHPAGHVLCEHREAPVLTGGVSQLSLLGTTAEHIHAVAGMLRERGLEGSQLASLTHAARADWAAASADDMQAALQGLEAAQLLPCRAATMWLPSILRLGPSREGSGTGWLDEATVVSVCRHLAQLGFTQDELLQLGRGMAAGSRAFVARLSILQQMLGSWHAAAEAMLSDATLGRLPTASGMWRIAAGLGAAGLSREQLLELANAAAAWPHHRYQLDGFIVMAERLYGGDWRGAALKLLAERETPERHLWCLQPALDDLQQLGLQVANEQGRVCVLQLIQDGQDLGWSVDIPQGTPAAERRSAAAAALEAEGFRAVGGAAGRELVRLPAGEITSFGVHRSFGMDLVLTSW